MPQLQVPPLPLRDQGIKYRYLQQAFHPDIRTPDNIFHYLMYRNNLHCESYLNSQFLPAKHYFLLHRNVLRPPSQPQIQ